MAANVATKTRVLDKKLNDISSKGQKPAINAIAQGFRPSHQTLATQVNKFLRKCISSFWVIQNDDDKSDSSLTSIDDTNPQRKISTGYLPQNAY